MLTDVLIRQVAGDVFRGFEPQRRDHVTVGASYEIIFTGPIEGDLGGWHRFVWAKEPVQRERCFGTGMAPSDRRKRSTGLWNCCGGLTGERRSCVHRYPYGSNDLWEIERCSLRSGYWVGVASAVMLELSGFQAQKKTSVDVFRC